jgi:outer membrane autotransporter protein
METRRTIGEALGTSRSRDGRSYFARIPLRGLALLFGAFLGTVSSRAQSIWTPLSQSADWNTASNWSPARVPTVSAFFPPRGGLLNVTIAQNTTIGVLDFDGKVEKYDFTLTGSAVLSIEAGILNPSPDRPIFVANSDQEQFQFNGAMAGRSNFINSLGGATVFNSGSTAGFAIITNSLGGATVFNSGSTAGFATITNNLGGATVFNSGSTAGFATITNNLGGTMVFNSGSTAGFASIINNPAGKVMFVGTGTGGDAQFFNEGVFDISFLTVNGITARSIEGSGTFFLGSKALTVGMDNDSSLVSGNIVDGGINGGTGGSLIKVGTGTLRLSGINTYTGGTTVSGGTLQAGSTTGFSPSSAFTADSTLDLDGFSNTVGSLTGTGTVTTSGATPARLTSGGDNTSTTFSGILEDGIAASLGLTKVGSGTLSLRGANTYTGGTTITGGTLQIGNGGTTGSIVGNVLDNGSLVFNRSDAITFPGIVSGTGSLSQTGSGSLTLIAANTYSGGTVIDRGTLLVDNARALGVGNVTVNGGILAADPQPIKVKGNYTQNAGGTLQLKVAAGNPGQYDTLNVGGNAALGGTLKLISLGFQPKAGDALTLVTTGGSVSGHLGQFVDPFAGPGFTLAGLVYEPGAVLLEFRTAASFALTPNQLAAASLIDAVHQDPRAANLISFLSAQPFANLPADFQKISPDGLTSFYEISFSNASIQKLNLESRLDDLHNGSNGFSSNMKVNGATVNDKAGPDGKTSKAVMEPVLQHAPENRWGVWVTGFGDFVNVDGDANAQGYNFTTGGVSLGLDYRLTGQLAIGVFGDYSHTWTSLNPSGHIDVDSGQGGVYATWFSHGIYLNAAIYGGHNSYDSGRAALGGLANGSTEGAEWSTFIGGGYDSQFGPLTVGPIASLQYTDLGIDSFSEKGSLAPMAIHSDSAESLRSDVGFRLFYQWQIGKIIVEPSLKAAWEHEYKYSALPMTAGFAGIPGSSATFSGPSEGHDSAVVSAGVSVQLTAAISIYLNYDGQLARDNYDSNAVTGGVRISF